MIILEQVLVNMICMNNLFINLLEAYHKDKFEDLLKDKYEEFVKVYSSNQIDAAYLRFDKSTHS